MKTSHLQTCHGSIRCTGCGREFEMSAGIFCDPIRLIGFKEGIAAKHVCRPTVVHTRVRVWRNSGQRDLDAYYSGAIRRFTPAH